MGVVEKLAGQDVLAGITVIDADTHYSEPADMWTRRAPANMKNRVPRIEQVDGIPCWMIDDIVIGRGATASSSITPEGEKPSGLACVNWRNEDVHAGSWNLKPRLEVMDQCGIFAQIVYPNILGFGGQNAARVDHELRLLSTRLYNDAMAELQADSGGRIFPMALLPWWDVNEAVRETERCAAMGMRGINIHTDPQNHVDAAGNRLPDLAGDYWAPLWEVCVDRGLPVNFHIGASDQAMDWMGDQGWPSLDFETKAGLGGAMLFFNNGRVMGNIIMSGLLDRHPKLQFVSVESGIGWIPFLLEALDYQYREVNTQHSLQRLPSEYFRTNFHGCFWFEQRDLSTMVRSVGVDNVMFETDFPHPTCLSPRPLERSVEGLATLDTGERTKVLGGNAARLYNIDVPAIDG